MLVVNGFVFLNGIFEKKDLRIADGVFAAIAEPGTLTAKPGEEVISVKDGYVLPGLVDIHSHGRSGEDFSFVTEKELQTLCDSYAACGVTAVLGTTMTNRPERVEESIQAIGAYRNGQHSGAKLLGVHMEGPFLGKDKKGAHDVQYLTPPNQDWFDKLSELSGNSIRLITVDPCLPGAEQFVRTCKEKGVAVSLGHTSCDYALALEMKECGADHVTHCFNAMNPLHHREPGLIGAALDTGMYTELICDGIHLHPSIIRMMFAAHPEQQLLISDSMQAAGLPDGEYELGGLKVYVKAGKATQADGTIAGSTTNVFDAMVNVIRFGVPAEYAVQSASYLPAKSIGMEKEVGSIALERCADFLVVSNDWSLEQVFINGTSVKA